MSNALNHIGDLHEYALVLNEKLDHLKYLHRTKNISIIFTKDGSFSRFEIKQFIDNNPDMSITSTVAL